ncbi:MAG: efflux RND transporter periplasmic adaptor subunit [Eudoraea sp.]|nr:efflux RND transporter periplasmic adaptor subunit [Eudoraea sp.]
MKRSIYLLSILLLLITFFGCKSKETESSNADEKGNLLITVSQEQFELGEMKLGVPEEREFPETVQATGIIEVPPQNKAVVSAFIGGYIKDTPLLIGDQVKKGQLLLTIENPEFVSLQQNYLETRQQLTFLEAEYERQKQLIAENISSQKSFLKAESDYKGKLALYNGLKQKLSMLNFSIEKVEEGDIRSVANIYAPIFGSITKNNVTKGMYVSPSDEILEITDNDHIHLELSVFEKDIMKLRKGQTIWFTIPESSEEVFEAEVYLIGTNIEKNRTIKVHGHLKDEEKHTFLTGMFVDSRIVTSSSLKKALPSVALAEINNTYYALKLTAENDTGYVFEKVTIRAGEQFDGFTALESYEGKDGESRFLINGAFPLLTE